ncbi:glycosyltransferase [Pyrobaculum aerophilum]|uniref:glycosyltransferase n=1 Tax=Pyrobaculum aerophilum TaxID=13773 RepID=UPI0023F3FFB3|nr:glycosyltransferase [Pyrobaculum aerophilum]MCX8137672.1 glycosyltransferase [Pyrobaculum aerophilum]
MSVTKFKIKHTKIIAYTYQSTPWRRTSGDDVRIDTILKYISRGELLYAFTLGLDGKNQTVRREKVLYLVQPRPVYSLLSKIFNWKNHYDLNPLAKATLYIDEIILALRLARMEKTAIYIFGSMTLMPAFLRTFGYKGKIIYDPLSNYAQTLYLRSRKSLSETLKYGLYLALHRVALRASDVVIYPSRIDRDNAIRMYRNLHKKTIKVVPNPIPICYQSIEEYNSYRSRKADDKPHFVLLARSNGASNEEAVKLTIEVFSRVKKPYKLTITGSWHHLNPYNPNIKIVGYLPTERLKELLATADYGLVPVFTHAAGTFLKTITYIAAGLDVITTPLGIDLELIQQTHTKIYLLRRPEDYLPTVNQIIDNHNPNRDRKPLLCTQAEKRITEALEGLG